MKRVLAGVLLLMGVTVSAAGGTGEAPLPVAVSIAPQAWLVERIGGDLVDITVAVTPGESPHAFDPTPRHVARLADAAIYFATGVPMENHLLARLQNSCPQMQVIDTSAGIPLRSLEGDGHDHGHDHGHDADPHVWLAPLLVKQQARQVTEALVARDPAHADRYRSAGAAVAAEIDTLQNQLARTLAPLAGREFFVLHPAFGYFADAYGLVQVSIEPSGGEPSPRQLAEVFDRVQAAGVRTVFTQPEVSLATANAVARSCDVELVVLDPLAPDWDTNLRRMALTIREALDAQ